MKSAIIAWLAMSGSAMAGPLDGLYSDVCLNRETGDQGGLELVLRTVADKPSVIFKICEGGCWSEETQDLKLEDNVMEFTSVEQIFDGKGKLAETRRHRFRGAFRNGVLKLGSPGYWPSESLRRRKPYLPSISPDQASDWPIPIGACK